MPDFSSMPPWLWALAAILFSGLMVYRPSREAFLILARLRLGGGAPSAEPLAFASPAAALSEPAPACGPEMVLTDEQRWAALNEIEGGSPYPVIAFGYDMAVRVINDEAMDLLGYHYHQVIGHDITLLVADDDEDAFRSWLDTYLRKHKAGEALKLQKTAKPLRLKTSSGALLPVVVYWTHFGNGHGGMRCVLMRE